MPQVPLEQLFAAFLATGEELAFEQLMRRSAPELRRLARRLGASAEDAEDLVQETMVAAIQAADRFDPRRPLLPWLRGILTFRTCRLVRDEGRRRRAYRCEDREPVDRAPALADDLAGRELGGDVDAAIAGLPAQYREPLRHFLLGERTPVEIAAQLGVGRATVRVRLHRGLQRLRERLGRWRAVPALAWLWPERAAIGRPAATAWRAGALLAVGLAAAFALGLAIAWQRPAAAPASAVLAAAAADPGTNLVPAAIDVDPVGNGAVARRAAVPPTTELLVTVRDARGAAVPGVGLALAPAHGRDPVLHRRRAVTDVTGRAHFALPAAGTFALASDRGAATELALGAGANDCELRIADGVAVRGRVVTADGEPIANAAVWLGSEADAPWRGDEVARSAADGSFALQHVPAGAFLVARHARHAPSDLARCADGGERPIELRLGGRAAGVAVAVHGPDGAPVADALVFVGEAMDAAPLWLAQGAAPFRSPPCEGRTDARGRFVCAALPPGEQPVFVRAVGFAPYVGRLSERERSGDGDCVVALQRGGRVHGRVVDPDGQAIAGATVVFRAAMPAASADLAAAADGTFAFELVPGGTGQVAARAAGFVPRALAVQVVPGRTDEVVVALARASRIDGRVVDAGGAPVAASVRASWPEAALTASRAFAACDADGAFAVRAEVAARPQLAVQLAGEPLWRAVDVHAHWRGEQVIVQLPPGFAATSWLHGELRCADGAPLAAARLFVRGSEGWAEIGRSDTDGAFRLGPLPAGSYDLVAETTSPRLPTVAVGTFALAAGEDRAVAFAAEATGTLDLEFARADGAPLGDLAVTVVGAALDRRCAIGSGEQLRQQLTPGEYFVFAMGNHVEWLERLPVRIEAGAVHRQRIELRPGRRCTLALAGLPAAVDAAPRALVLTAAAREGWSATFTLLADAPPRVAAVLAVGDYRLRHVDAEGRRWLGTFAVGPGDGDTAIEVTLAPE